MKREAIMKILPLLTLAATFVALGSGPTLSQIAATGDAAKGKQAYLDHDCYSCHGRVGEGGAFMYLAPPLAGLNWPAVALQWFLRAAPNDMPSFAPTSLADDDIANIGAFLRSLPGRSDPKDFPLLNQ
jgi:mono/diheme cytochrome c family protein